MKIADVVAVPIHIPLESPYTFARGSMTGFKNVIVKMVTDEGITGYGESAPLFRTLDPVAIARAVNEIIRPVILGLSPLNTEQIIAAALELVEGDTQYVSGIDLALWDIMGQHFGVPIHDLLGGQCEKSVLVDYTVTASDPGEMAEVAAEVCERGYPGVVVKATGESLDRDVEGVHRVREVLPPDKTVRVDSNGGYDTSGAVAFLKAIVDLDIEFVEQPVPPGDIEGLKQCRSVGIPISVDEGLMTLRDAIDLVSAEACDVMNIKVPRVGGLLLAKRMAAIADAAGLPVVVGGRTSFEISRAASRHFAVSTPGTLARAHEGPGPASQRLSDDVVDEKPTLATVAEMGGRIPVEQGPGLGIHVNWDKVLSYRIS